MKIKMGLLPKLILGIIAGVVIGYLGNIPVIRAMATAGNIFGNFLNFVIPLIIIGFVAPGIGDLGSKAGKLLGITVILAYGSTIFAGTVAYLTDSNLFPLLLKGKTLVFDSTNPETSLLTPFFTIEMPPVLTVMSALLLAFIIGLGMSALQSNAFKNLMNEFQLIVEKIIKKVIIPALPYYIACIFANMTHAGVIFTIFSVFSKVFLVIICLHTLILIILYIIAAIFTQSNPFILIKRMIPAYFTAIGTQSSAATIPVTLAQTKKNGINKDIAEFVIPLCATIHLSGSTITLVSCSIAVMMISNMAISFSLIFGFILMLGVTMIAAPGVPGGAVMAALGLLQTMLGFSPELIGLMIALYIAQDSFGTACNVTGDGAIAAIVNKISGYKLEKNVILPEIENI